MVVLLPLPVTPARMIMPWSKWHSFSMLGGRPSLSKVGMLLLTRRATKLQLAPLAEEVDAEAALHLGRRRGHSRCRPRSSSICFCRCVSVGIINRSMSSWVSGCHFHLADVPLSRIIGGSADFQMQVGALMFHDHAEELVDFRFALRSVVTGGGKLWPRTALCCFPFRVRVR